MFYNTDRVANCNIEGVTERLRDQIAGAWVSFAYTGNPNHSGLPKWEQYSNGKVTMVFDRECGGREDMDTALLEAMNARVPHITIGKMMNSMSKRALDTTSKRDWIY